MYGFVQRSNYNVNVRTFGKSYAGRSYYESSSLTIRFKLHPLHNCCGGNAAAAPQREGITLFLEPPLHRPLWWHVCLHSYLHTVDMLALNLRSVVTFTLSPNKQNPYGVMFQIGVADLYALIQIITLSSSPLTC